MERPVFIKHIELKTGKPPVPKGIGVAEKQGDRARYIPKIMNTDSCPWNLGELSIMRNMATEIIDHLQVRPFCERKISLSVVVLLILLIPMACSSRKSGSDLEMKFEGHYGQVEIGGKYVGVEFHQSRPLPSRISFYSPVANSLDISNDYWKRFKSMPYTVLLTSEGITDTIGMDPFPYRYTPYRASFEDIPDDTKITFSYDVCEDIPVLVLRITIKNLSERSRDILLETALNTTLRTSHTYTWKKEAILQYPDNGTVATAFFADIETDSAVVFIVNAGEMPAKDLPELSQEAKDPVLHFAYPKKLDGGEQLEVVQLLGMCRLNEADKIIGEAKLMWWKSVLKNENRILDYTYNQTFLSVPDPILQQTAYWSKAMLASDIHYINGQYLPMPCPAEYNFFFTHDLLLTGLGAVNFDLDYVKHGFQFLHSLTKEDSILAHAYYWKDMQFVTEYCNSDNWNHLWLIISACSYLKHSADKETVEAIFPMIKKSLQMMLKNKGDDGLIYAQRPDWWDIGNVYGAKTYITSLMYKALRDFVYIAIELEKDNEPLADYLQFAVQMKEQLVEKLWDEEAGYLFNFMDNETLDRHYYSGSLIAAYYDLLDDSTRTTLLLTAKDTLLDQYIGIRNAMPPDFHELIPQYHFNGMEAGAPFFYFNGGVWPQGSAWYALGLLANDQPDDAKQVLKKYLTLDGIQNSPHGQPSFYEYRFTDPKSGQYGEIDKPTFLWAAGWYLHVLYQLMGLRENSWNIFFNPSLPAGLADTEYDLTLFGQLCRITWQGQGNYFQEIRIDGIKQPSAVITSLAKKIVLKRGVPETPYLARSNCIVDDVRFTASAMELVIAFSGIKDQIADITIISPFRLQRSKFNGSDCPDQLSEKKSEQIYKYIFKMKMTGMNNELVLHF